MTHETAQRQRDEMLVLRQEFPRRAKERDDIWEQYVEGRHIGHVDWKSYVAHLYTFCKLPRQFAMPDDLRSIRQWK